MTMDADKGRTILTLFVVFVWACFMVALLLVGGCGSVSIQKNADGSYQARTMSLFKDIKDVNIDKDANGDVSASMGSSISTNEEAAFFLVCTINPALPICQQSP